MICDDLIYDELSPNLGGELTWEKNWIYYFQKNST
jgi:hypothetical protein